MRVCDLWSGNVLEKSLAKIKKAEPFLTLPSSPLVPFTRSSYFFFFLNLAPVSPTNPGPNNSMVAGSEKIHLQMIHEVPSVCKT